MIFVIITLLAFIYTIFLGIYKQFALNKPKKYLLSIFITVTVISIISGISEGTIYSHGFDFPWWGFSILSIVCILIIAIILVGLMHIIERIKNRNR